jgi:gamma-glutamyl-gamma-aminobutyrate hydrolase PuuD
MDKIVLITMRSTDVDGNLIDSIDRRYYELVTQILGKESRVFPIPNIGNDVKIYVERMKPDLIILSGGNDLCCVSKPINCDAIRDLTEKTLLQYAVNIPVLGICRGMQLISTYFGSKLTEVENHVANNHIVKFSSEENNHTSMLTNSFHRWGVNKEDLSKDLMALHTEGASVESFKHQVFPWIGVMWHPERSDFNSESRIWVVNEISKIL